MGGVQRSLHTSPRRHTSQRFQRKDTHGYSCKTPSLEDSSCYRCMGLRSNIWPPNRKAPYDALRNRGHLSLASWNTLEQYSDEIATSILKPKISPGAWECLEASKSRTPFGFGHCDKKLMAEAMAASSWNGCCLWLWPESRQGWLSGSNEDGPSSDERKSPSCGKGRRDRARAVGLLRLRQHIRRLMVHANLVAMLLQ